jgi:VanZ family protein
LPGSTVEREPAQRKKVGDPVWKTWIAAVLWLGIIAVESTKLLSSENTGAFLYKLVTRIVGTIDIATFEIWHHYLRKTGHVVGYAVLSWLLFRAWRATLPVFRNASWTFRWALVSFLMTAMVASLDEWHQSFIPSRTGTPWDVLLDSCAALGVQLVIYAALRNRSNQM